MLSCPRCNSERVHPSKAGWLNFLASLFRQKAYRCTFCHKTFFRPANRKYPPARWV
jgi:transposase-like protein